MSALNPAVAGVRPASRRLEVAPVLAVAAPLAVVAVALAVAAPGLTVQDTWLTLVSGREIVEHGLPYTDHLTLLARGHHWVDQQWLGALFLFVAARAGGLGLALALCMLAIVVAFGVAAHTAHRRGASPLAILLFLAAAVVAAPWGLQLRAQALALPLFAMVLSLLVNDPRAERRSTLLVLPLLCVWANVHGSVVLGVALTLAYAFRTHAWSYALAPATMLVSPYATQLPGYYRMMLLDPPFGRYVQEWHRTTPSALTAAFFALAVLTIVLVLVRRGRLDRFDQLALALTLVVALQAIRGLIWFGVAAITLLPALATRTRAARFDGRPAAVFAGVALATTLGALGVAAARPAHAYEARFPAGLADVVRAGTASGGRVLANEATADWLLWKAPELRGRVAYDVRFEVLTRAQVAQLLTWRSFGTDWQRIAERYAVVVDDPAHVSRLVATGRWRRTFAGSHIAVAERIAGAR